MWLITVLSPGPNLFATVHVASTRSRWLGVMFSAGIAVGTATWACASLLGLGILFQATAWLYQCVKLVGGGYLVYLGVKTILSAGTRSLNQRAQVRAVTAKTAFLHGVAVDLSNPKAAEFAAQSRTGLAWRVSGVLQPFRTVIARSRRRHGDPASRQAAAMRAKPADALDRRASLAMTGFRPCRRASAVRGSCRSSPPTPGTLKPFR